MLKHYPNVDAVENGSKPRRLGRSETTGFTLVELLVSISILTLLLLMMSKLVDSTTLVTTGGKKRMDSDSRARMVFEQMAVDFSGMVKRADVDALFSKSQGTGNDAFFFYSESPGYYTGDASMQGTTALIGYRVNANYQLERLGKGLSWAGDASETEPGCMVYSISHTGSDGTYSSTLAAHWPKTIGLAPYSSGSDDAYHVLADGVFRLDYCFLMKSGTYSTVRGFSRPFDDVAAIVITIGILDATSRAMLPGSRNPVSGELISDLSKPTQAFRPGEDQTVASSWHAALNNPQSLGIPLKAASGIHVYQKYFSLNTK